MMVLVRQRCLYLQFAALILECVYLSVSTLHIMNLQAEPICILVLLAQGRVLFFILFLASATVRLWLQIHRHI